MGNEINTAKKHIHKVCGTEVCFKQESYYKDKGYKGSCPECDEDLFPFEMERTR